MDEDGLEFPLRIGRLARALGLRGEVVLQSFRRREHAADPRRLEWRRLKRPLEMELEHPNGVLAPGRVTHARWLDAARVALRIEGISDRNAAEGLIGAYLDIDPERPAPEICDAVDACFDARAIDADTGATLGRVRAIRDNGAQALLELERAADPDGAPAHVPVVPEIVVGQGEDAQGRWVELRPPAGLLDVNL